MSVVELMTIEGCPNEAPARALLDRIAPGIPVERVLVLEWDEAERLRFLGSPTIRVDGRDVEPGADERTTYAIGCRVYPNGAGVPDERWLRDALAQS